MSYIVEELCGNQSCELEVFEELEEAKDYMIKCAGNDVMSENFDSILDEGNQEWYQREFTNALSYYNITNRS